jgi:thymidylate synthase (FAD)
LNEHVCTTKIALLGTMNVSVIDVAQAAWTSTAAGEDRSYEDALRVSKFMAREGHWTPFAQSFLQFHFHVPIFVARQMMRHNIGIVWNEESRRYVKSEPKINVPLCNEFRSKSETLKQGSGGELPFALSVAAETLLCKHSDDSIKVYNGLLDLGLCPEQARMALPLNTMTNIVGSFNLWSLFNFYKKRIHKTAQVEIQKVAQRIDELVSPISDAWVVLKENRNG